MKRNLLILPSLGLLSWGVIHFSGQPSVDVADLDSIAIAAQRIESTAPKVLIINERTTGTGRAAPVQDVPFFTLDAGFEHVGQMLSVDIGEDTRLTMLLRSDTSAGYSKLSDRSSDALVGCCWIVVGRDGAESNASLEMLGGGALPLELEELRAVGRSMNSQNVADWAGAHASPGSQELTGDTANQLVATELGAVDATSSALVIRHDGGSAATHDLAIAFQGSARVQFDDMWSSVEFTGKHESYTEWSSHYELHLQFRGGEWETGSQVIETRPFLKPSCPQHAASLLGSWERFGDEFEGMRIRFMEIGGDYFALTTKVPGPLEATGWREGLIKFRSPRASGDDATLLSLFRNKDASNSHFREGTYYINSDDVLVWKSNDPRGSIGSQQLWKRLSR